LIVPPGETLTASFQFQLPYLPAGEYAVSAAIAEGTQANHQQHHWMDEAMFFKVLASHIVHGIVGVPMQDIRLETVGANTPVGSH
jgi:lipopolysaccharide transport system ATP-binding protein